MIEFLSSHGTRAAGLPFSDAVRVGGVLYLSGALGSEPGTMRLVPGGIAAETRQTMTNIARVLEQSGLSFD
ncbi:MAG TPA: Rid family hydrolase, partial [Rhizomicrobium sp.]|nr:Rid family hydrolase [Rhizomicrobium sp.]